MWERIDLFLLLAENSYLGHSSPSSTSSSTWSSISWSSQISLLLELVLETFSWFEEEVGAVLPMEPGWRGARDGATRSTSMESWSALSSAEADRSSASELISILSLFFCRPVLSIEAKEMFQKIRGNSPIFREHSFFKLLMSFRLNNRHGKACW